MQKKRTNTVCSQAKLQQLRPGPCRAENRVAHHRGMRGIGPLSLAVRRPTDQPGDIRSLSYACLPSTNGRG